MRVPLRLLPLLGAAALLAACGQTMAESGTPPSTSTEMPTSVPAAPGEVTARTMVLEEDDGPRLCLGGSLQSLPPQCDGPGLVGFEWSDVTSESAGGVRWAGAVRVTGRWDGTTLTLTEPATDQDRGDARAPELKTLCDEPAGGWVRERDRVGEADLDKAGRVLDERSDVLRVHVTYVGEVGERLRTDIEGVDADGTDTVASTVLNVVTTDPAAVRKAMEPVWGGGLCVVQGTGLTEKERRRINDEIWKGDETPPGALSGGAGPETVDLVVTYDDGSIQRALDAEYGEGVVTVVSALQPAGSGTSTD